MKELRPLFDSNRAWRAERLQTDPEYFEKLAAEHKPKYLWIGCADARVPANQICGVPPGDMFVHRNIANVVVHSDFNCQSVLQFAVDVLRVEHVMVVGHYGCSGVRAAMERTRVGLADNWLHHVRDLHTAHAALLDPIGDEQERHDRLCEVNVIEQAMNVSQSNAVKDAWSRKQKLAVHGWIYRVQNGLLNDLDFTVTQADAITPAYESALADVARRIRDAQSA